MTPPFWRDGSGNLRPVYPCPRYGRDVPIYDDFRLVDLKRLGWSLFIPATYVSDQQLGAVRSAAVADPARRPSGEVQKILRLYRETYYR